MIENLIDRATRKVVDTLSWLISPFHKKGIIETEAILDDVLAGTPAMRDKLVSISDRWIKQPFLAWHDLIAAPSEFTPEAAAAMSKTFIPGVIAASAAIEAADTLAQMLPFGMDTDSIGKFGEQVWHRWGLTAATAATFQSPARIGLMRNLDYYYNEKFRSQKLKDVQAYDGVRYREFLTESEWAAFEGDVDLDKPIEEMTPDEIAAWAAKASGAVDSVEYTNTDRFREAMKWLGYKEDDILLQDRAAKHAPNLMMLRQMAMRGFFDAKFMARSIFKGGFDNWAIKPMLNFLGYMAQEGTWVGYRDAAQSAFVKGLIDEEELRSVLIKIHVPNFLLDPIIETNKLKKVHTERDLTTTQLLSAYLKGTISREECITELKGMGYTSESAEVLVKTKESTEQPSVRIPTLAQFSRAFREGLISEEDFKAYLGSRGYSAAYVNMLLNIEKAKFPTVKPKATMSTLGRAFREGIISEVVLKQKLQELGYSLDESNWINLLYNSQPKIATESLSKAEILKAMVAGLIDEHDASERLTAMGYSLEDIELLMKLSQPELTENVKYISEPVVNKLWAAGMITDEEVYNRLDKMGYTESDIYLLMNLNWPSSS